MKYNFQLEFGAKLSKRISEFAKNIKADQHDNPFYSDNYIPHISVLKFETRDKFKEDFTDDFCNDFDPIEVEFSGLGIIPSKKENAVWIEINVLKSKELTEFQEEVIEFIKNKNKKILNGVHDQYRPHVTLAKLKSQNKIKIPELEVELLRLKKVKVIPKFRIEYEWN